MRIKFRHLLGVLAAVLSTAGTAAPITVLFSGTVTDDPFGLGYSAFAGTYTFDDAASDGAPASDTGSYTSSGGGYGIEVSFDSGAATVSLIGPPATLNIGIANDFAGPVDQYTVTGLSGTVELGLFLEDITASVFASDALPPQPPALASFLVRQFRYFDTDTGNQSEILGTIDTLTCIAGCTPVDEPIGGALVAAALMSALAARRRRLGRR